MDPINTSEAKKKFSSLLQRVQRGESILIASHNKPIALLKPIEEMDQVSGSKGNLARQATRFSKNFAPPTGARLMIKAPTLRPSSLKNLFIPPVKEPSIDSLKILQEDRSEEIS